MAGNPEKPIKKLKQMHGISYPGDVFQFSISKETEVVIINQIKRDQQNIHYALKHKHSSLLIYYLNRLKILKDLIKISFIQNAYEESINIVSKMIDKFCTDTIETFNHAFTSRSRLKTEDICQVKT